jgi:hypothetical protein
MLSIPFRKKDDIIDPIDQGVLCLVAGGLGVATMATHGPSGL